MPSREAVQLRHEAGGEVRQISGVPPGHTPITVVGEVRVSLDLDPWLSLRALADYSGLSVRKLRYLLADPHHPLPAYRVDGKILVRRSDFDRWMQGHRATQTNLDQAVEAVLHQIRSTGK